MRTPFGRLHGRNPKIITISDRIGRTPSALAMKACNFASLDPDFRATERKGLSGASEADRTLWAEFTLNPEQIAAEAEALSAQLEKGTDAIADSHVQPPHGATDEVRFTRVRRVQSFFRAAVLVSYESRCAITGLPVPELLVASHIIPWSASTERRADPTNGICLNALFDRAFDRGLITFDEQLRVVVSRRLNEVVSRLDLDCSIRQAHGRPIRVPSRLAPDPSAIEHHRQHVFVG